MNQPDDHRDAHIAEESEYADPTSADQAPERRQQLRERDHTELVEQTPDSGPRLTSAQISEVRDRISDVGKHAED